MRGEKVVEDEVVVPFENVRLQGTLASGEHARNVVLFAHGSGSSRHSRRNRFVAAELQRRGLSTLLLDLLTPEEESADRYTRLHRFDIDLLAARLVAAADWLVAHRGHADGSIGCFGASTGAAAALIAAARRPALVGAVVSRGGRPDLAGREVLQTVRAPTLLIVGGNDEGVMGLNRVALASLRGEAKLEIVPEATHLFEEPGALERVADLAGSWFDQHLLMSGTFRDRVHAGQVLGDRLAGYRGVPDVVVLGLPRGGVPVAEQVALALGAPLDVFVVRKLGVPDHPELAMGAIASGGIRVFNEGIIKLLKISPAAMEKVTKAEQRELERREKAYRHGRPAVDVGGKTAIVVDDGLATGASMRAAIEALRQREAAGVVAAVPIGAEDSCGELAVVADDVVCAVTPEPFGGVGRWYEDFSQTTDEEVTAALERAASNAQLPTIADAPANPRV
jgi:putative phosphoribosyl transferase